MRGKSLAMLQKARGYALATVRRDRAAASASPARHARAGGSIRGRVCCGVGGEALSRAARRSAQAWRRGVIKASFGISCSSSLQRGAARAVTA